MDTFFNEPPVSSESVVRRWACASIGGVLAVAGYAALTMAASHATRTASAANLLPAKTSAAVSAAVAPVAQDVAMGAFVSAETRLDLVASGKPDNYAALARIANPTTRPATFDMTDAGFEGEHLTGSSVMPTSALSPDAVTVFGKPDPVIVTPTVSETADVAPSEPIVRGTTSLSETPVVNVLPQPVSVTVLPTMPIEPFGVTPVAEATTTEPADARPATVTWTPAKPAQATKPGLVASGLNEKGHLSMTVNRTAELKTNVAVKRISVGQPDVADVQPFASNLLLVTAKKVGTTQVIVWDDKDQSQSIDVSVEIPLDQLKELITKVAPGANVDVSVAGSQIVLRGQAPDLTVAKQINDLAGAFGTTQNFIEVAGAQTVAVQVQFAEVSRSVTNSLGVNWGFSDGTTIFGFQPGGSGLNGFHANDAGTITGLGIALNPGASDIFGLARIGSGSTISYFIKALRENNLLRVLQEPTLTTTSGEAASFLAGGQIPVPVPGDNGQTQIEYKEFGVRLKLTPVVLGNGKVRLVVEAESSDLDYANGTRIQNASVPGLRTRRVQNTVELGEGQTMSIAGLLDDSVVATKQSVPGLGDLPVIGQLFRSTRYQRKETELVILITPRLQGAMNPDQVTPLPGAGWRHPNELEQLAFGDLGGNAEADAARDWNKPSSERGLKAGETQKTTPRAQEPAAITKANSATGSEVARSGSEPTPPPAFFGEHGFTPAVARKQGAEATATTGQD